jgi:hypothetical protein
MGPHIHRSTIRLDESAVVLGKNGNGQLGLGDTVNRLVPTPINLVASRD